MTWWSAAAVITQSLSDVGYAEDERKSREPKRG